MICHKCGNNFFTISEKTTTKDGLTKYRKRCGLCRASKTIIEEPTVLNESKIESKKYVITSIQNDTVINKPFFESIKTFASHNKCEIILLKTYYFTAENLSSPPVWNIDHNLFDETFDIGNNLRILASLRLSNTSLNPLSGIDDFAKGKHIIVANNQLQMKTLYSHSVEAPIFAYTTGTISKPKYLQSKAGQRAKHNHSYSFIFVEIRGNKTFIRDVVSDDTGCFYDISGFYTPDGVEPLTRGVKALITGDEHAVKIDTRVLNATYCNSNSIVNTLKPEFIVRHDVLDFYSGSHHHENNFLLRFKKMLNCEDDVEIELDKTYKHIVNTTPPKTTNIIVESIHNEHLRKWLNHYDPKRELKNAKLYFGLMYFMLKHIENGVGDISPFEAFCDMKYSTDGFIFTKRDKELRLCDIIVSYHGDRGANGSKASLAQFTKAKGKHVIGHSHSPKIDKGNYQVGTSTGRLEYATGLTTWANTHCIIYHNGARQLITISDGEWC